MFDPYFIDFQTAIWTILKCYASFDGLLIKLHVWPYVLIRLYRLVCFFKLIPHREKLIGVRSVNEVA